MPLRKREYLKIDALEDVRKASKENVADLKQHLLDTSISKYREYLEFQENKDDDDAWAGLGGAYRRKGDIDQAIDSYTTAYQLNTASTYALVNLVSLMAARHRPEDEPRLQEYAATAEARLREKTADGSADHWTWYDMATLELIQGKASQSIQTLAYAIERTPKGARENFDSVLSNLQFLQTHNPTMSSLTAAINLVQQARESA